MALTRAKTGLLLLAVSAVLVLALRQSSPARQETTGRLTFTAHPPTGTVRGGSRPLALAESRDGFLFVPQGNGPRSNAPLLILLHGATQRARLFERITPSADSAGVAILAPDSRDVTWDAIRGEFGPDVEFLDRAIMRAFDNAYIDSCRVVVGGFSDGASYALSLGIRNSQRVRGVVAFSPGFVIPAAEVETLPVFMRHGTNDQILPIDRTSRPLLRALRGAGFEVDYQEFEGPHWFRPEDVRAALQWVSRRSCARFPRAQP